MGFFSGLSDSVILLYVNEQIRVTNEVLLVINLHRMYFNSLCWFQKDVTIHSWTCEANSDNIDSGMYKSSEVRTIHPLASKNGQRLRPPLVYGFFTGLSDSVILFCVWRLHPLAYSQEGNTFRQKRQWGGGNSTVFPVNSKCSVGGGEQCNINVVCLAGGMAHFSLCHNGPLCPSTNYWLAGGPAHSNVCAQWATSPINPPLTSAMWSTVQLSCTVGRHCKTATNQVNKQCSVKTHLKILPNSTAPSISRFDHCCRSKC